MLKWAFLWTVGLVVGISIYVYIKVGGYKPVRTEITEQGPFQLVYKAHLGAYNEIEPVLEEVEKWAKANGESCEQTFGEYIDNPKLVAQDRLRSNGGCVVTRDHTAGLPKDFSYKVVPRRLYLTAWFEGAPSIGPLKVYPKADSIMQKEGLKPDGSVLEFYRVLPGSQVETRYYFPVAQ